MKKIFKYLSYIFAAGFFIFIFLSAYFAFRFVSPNKVDIGSAPNNNNIFFENITFKTDDDLNLRGWYSKPDSGDKVIILLHGYKGNRKENYDKALMLKKYGYGVLTYDARACGESDGEHISLGYYEKQDLLSAIQFVKSKGANEIGLIGFSQGGATIIQSADYLPAEVKFVVLESVFPGLRNAIQVRFLKYFGNIGIIGSIFMIPIAELILKMDVDDVSPCDNVNKLQKPVLILTGENDTSLPLKDAFLVFESANEPKDWEVIENAVHQDLYNANKFEYESVVLKFIKKYY